MRNQAGDVCKAVTQRDHERPEAAVEGGGANMRGDVSKYHGGADKGTVASGEVALRTVGLAAR